MECGGRRMLSIVKSRQKKEREKSFLENGSLVLEKIIVSFKGRHNIPLRDFSAEEIFKATNDFGWGGLIVWDVTGKMFKGCFKQRSIIVKKFDDTKDSYLVEDIHDMVMTSQMSHHKNVLKLLGCCLEFKFPAMVYEYAGTQLLSDLLFSRKDGDAEHGDRSLPWKSRLRIAKEIANVIVYLHTAFPTPIVHRDIRASNVFLDPCCVAKVFDFGLCILLPPGESQVEVAAVSSQMGYLDREYLMRGIVTAKMDVFSFGLLLLQLLTGQRPYNWYLDKDYFEKRQFNEILDPRILGEGVGTDEQQQLQAFLALALSCSLDNGEDRPEMIHVAKELRRIERFIHP